MSSSTIAWIQVVATDLDTYLTGVKVEALREAALADDQPDPFIGAHADVIARIRNKIKACTTNTVSETANSIPPELKTCACWLILEAMNARIGLSRNIQLTEDQKTLIKKFERDLDQIAMCDLPVSAPVDPALTDVQAGGTVRVITSSTRTATRVMQNGLL